MVRDSTSTSDRPTLPALRILRASRRQLRQLLRLPPPLLAEPLAAWARRSERAAFACPVERCAHPFGLTFRSWNPFVETARQIASGASRAVTDSALETYYRAVQPVSAAEALLGFGEPPKELHYWHPVAAYCLPWEPLSPAQMEAKVRGWIADDHRLHGRPELTIESGFKYFGPVDPALAQLEYQRLLDLVGSLRVRGYRRHYGDVVVEVLVRGHEFLYLTNGGGMHRTVAAAGTGLAVIPARPARRPIDVDDVDDWPNVRSGLWTARQARGFFHHLFDFDYRRWAAERGLAAPPPT